MPCSKCSQLVARNCASSFICASPAPCLHCCHSWGFTLPSTENYCVKFTLLYRAPKDAAQHEANAVAMARSGVRCINCTPDGEFEAVVLKARDAVIPDRVLSMFRIMEAPSTDDPLLCAWLSVCRCLRLA